MAAATLSEPVPICCERVESISMRCNPAVCVLASRRKILVSRFLASRIMVGDEIAFPIPARDAAGPEIYVTKAHSSHTACL
jgi:hypothetical protein